MRFRKKKKKTRKGKKTSECESREDNTREHSEYFSNEVIRVGNSGREYMLLCAIIDIAVRRIPSVLLQNLLQTYESRANERTNGFRKRVSMRNRRSSNGRKRDSMAGRTNCVRTAGVYISNRNQKTDRTRGYCFGKRIAAHSRRE